MADQDWNGLPYGHFGNAIYQPEEKSWKFEKVLEQPHILEPVGDAEVVVPPSRLPSGDAKDATQRLDFLSLRQDKETTDLVRSAPAFQPATSLLRPLLHASEAVQDVTSRHDPARGTLLSFGRVFDEATRRSTQVVAFAAGPTGSHVRIVQVQLQKQGWDDSRDVWLEMPVVSGEEALWKGEGSPVQQVTFAQPLESGENLLAVRSSSRVRVFKPVLRKAGPSRLQLKPLFDVATTQNNGVPFADVAFNPWFPRQFAVIDEREHWRVWEFRSRQSSDATRIHSGVPDNDVSRKPGFSDGWARLVWIYNPSTVLVATRRAVTLYDIASGSSKLQDVEVNLSDVSGWVLDVASVPSDPARVMVLTTTHLHLICVYELNGETRARSAMRIRHFRSPEDITLRLTLFREEEALTTVMHSALSTTIVAYFLDLDREHSSTLHDPTQFQMNLDSYRNFSAADILELHVQSISTADRRQARGAAKMRTADVDQTLAGRLRQEGCRFMSLTALKKDLSVASLLHIERPPQYRITSLMPPTWRGKLMGTSTKVKDSFLVDDELVDMETTTPRLEPLARYVKQRRQRANRLFGTEWTLPYEHVALQTQRRGDRTDSMDNVLTQVRNLLEQPLDPEFAPMQTPVELAIGELTMGDTDLVLAKMTELTTLDTSHPSQLPVQEDDAEQSTRIVLRPVQSITLPGLPSTHLSRSDTTSTYNMIVSHWISSLPQHVPGRIRLAKEQLARRLAAELTLASHVFQLEDVEEPAETQPDAKPTSQDQSWDLPMHLASSQPFSSQLQSQSQSILPTPSPTGTPSVTTVSSRTSTFASAEISHLKKYTTFTKPTPSALPRSLTKILNHWALGSDPAAYDWAATSRSITQQTREEEADSQLTEKQRARAHRKAERHMRRQRKEAQASQVQMLASSQMPELVVSASQPQHAGGRGERMGPPAAPAGRQGVSMSMGGLPGSSQSLAPVAASQSVAGRFGGAGGGVGVGRPPAKKKRKQGF